MRMRGEVKWFNDGKGYGFATPDDGSREVFLHHARMNLEGDPWLREGERIEYDRVEGMKGPEAANVRRLI